MRRLLFFVSIAILTSTVVKSQPGLKHTEHYIATEYNTRLLDDGEYFWTLTYGGMVRFEKFDHSYKVFPYFTKSLAKDARGRIWAYGDSTIERFNGSTWDRQVFYDDTLYPPGTFYGHDSDWVREPIFFTLLAFDSKSNPVAIANSGLGRVSMFRLTDTGWTRVHLPSFATPFSIEGLVTDGNDDIWLSGEENPPGPDYSRFGYSVVARLHDTSVTQWREEDNLPSHKTSGDFRSIALDSSGFIWVSRTEAASKFDGSKWTLYNRDTSILASGGSLMNVGRGGVLWFAGYGVSNLGREGWAHYRQPFFVNILRAGTSGNEWAATYNGAWRFSGGVWNQFRVSDGLPDTTCLDVIADSSGEVLVATDLGVARFDGTRWSTYAIANSPAGNQSGVLALDHSNTLWVGGQEDNGEVKAVVQRLNAGTWETWNAPSPLPSMQFTGLALDAKGNPWITTDSGGLSWFENGHWSTVSLFDTAANHRHYLNLAADSSGGIWTTCLTKRLIAPVPPRYYVDNQEVLLWKDGSWTHFGPNDIRNRAPFSFNSIAVAPDQTVWATGAQADTLTRQGYNYRGGLYRFNAGRWETLNLEDNAADQTFLVGDLISSQSNGTLWISYQDAVKLNDGRILGPIVHYDGHTWSHYGGKQGQLPGVKAYCFAEDLDGEMLAGTELGVVKFDGTNWAVKYPVGEDLLGTPFSIAVSKDGSMWVSTQGNGIAHLNIPTSDVRVGNQSHLSIQAYPNPASGNILHIRFSTNVEHGVASIVSITGQELIREEFNAVSISPTNLDLDIKRLRPGAYYLKVSGVEGYLPVTKME